MMKRTSRIPDRMRYDYNQTQALDLAPEILAHNRIVMGLPHDPRSDVFRILRTRILGQLRAHQWNSLAVTSPSAGDGKSMISANLAIALALEGNQTVLLVDMDFRTPRLAHYLGIPPGHGLTDYLAGRIGLEQILVNPGIERLIVIPGGKSEDAPSEWIASPRMAALISEIRERYANRIILLDLPPLFQAGDAEMLIPQLDGVLLVVEDGKHPPEEIRHALLLLQHTNLLGLVLNKARNGG